MNAIPVRAIPIDHNANIFPSIPPAAEFAGNFNEDATRQYLSSFSWPKGLINTFITNIQSCPIRYVIVDDSGSMAGNVHF